MTDEEVKAYVSKIEETPIEEIADVLPQPTEYNVDIKMSKICDALSENIDTLRELNNESENQELDEEINDLLEKLLYCSNYLDSKTNVDDLNREVKHRLVFAKTPAGKPYFLADLNKVPREAYEEVKTTLDYVIYGVNMADKTKVKYYTNIDLPLKVLEFKGYQIRIYTTKLKNHVLCVIGIDVKKATYDRKLKENLKFRLSQISKQVAELKTMMNNQNERAAIFNDSSKILEEIMGILNKQLSNGNDVEEIEELFPQVSDIDSVDAEVVEPVEADEQKEDTHEAELKSLSTSKKVKRRKRGLAKKTIARGEIVDSLKGFTLEELMEVQKFITNMKMNKELNNSIGDMYSGFLSMTDEQIQGFENSIKDFKNDELGKHK